MQQQSAPDQKQQAPLPDQQNQQQAPDQQNQQQGQYPPTSTQPGLTSSPTATPSDSMQVQSQIQTAFQKDPTLANSSINVSVNDNKVKLTGTASTNAEKDKAKSIAEANAGGRKVVDKIKVSGSQTSGSQTPASPY